MPHHTRAMTVDTTERRWWKEAAVYQSKLAAGGGRPLTPSLSRMFTLHVRNRVKQAFRAPQSC